MAEVIGLLVEALVGLVVVLVEAIPVIIEVLFLVAIGSITIIAYAISPKFREKKRKEWSAWPKKKYLDLGISGVCLGLIAGLTVWAFLPPPKPARTGRGLTIEKSGSGKGMRLRIKYERKEKEPKPQP